jgi:hydrogenase-4 component B
MLLIPFFKVREKGIITIVSEILSAGISGFIAVRALLGDGMEFALQGTFVTGEIPIRIDALSGWFILLINFTMVTGALYGLQYMKSYRDQASNISLHCITYLLLQSSLTIICVVQNALVFLFAWEIMALSSFVLIIFEHYKIDTIKAGINFLIQAHVGIVFLYIGFIWVASRTNSYDFNAITQFSSTFPWSASLVLFLCFFIGFAIKAGFVPFHTWLPLAHPAAPSHISGVMSGVIIKIGIYGILRMILLIKTDYILLGFILLFISVVSGIYGVMLAIIQHNLKKLLAYHSIENIGIIGIGIALGTIGIGTNNFTLTTLGFAGAMLHVLNHSLFKSLLFYGAGNVYQATHTMNIEQLGGLIKRMPHTAVLFLIAALAICGLPPFNGFISEFLIYSGLFNGLSTGTMISVMAFLFSVFGLVLIGGLAFLCFTKAFGSVFLGNSRHHTSHPSSEANTGKLIPMYMVVVLMIAIGLNPKFFLQLLSAPLKLFSDKLILAPNDISPVLNTSYTMELIGWCALGFIILSGIILFLRNKIANQKTVALAPTWGCGYVGDTAKMQYTASSFIRTYRKLAEPVLSLQKNKQEVVGVFPQVGWHETHPLDKIEEVLIKMPLKQLRFFFNRFQFLQNGNPQFYVLYGIIFILLIIGVPYLYEATINVIEFFNLL